MKKNLLLVVLLFFTGSLVGCGVGALSMLATTPGLMAVSAGASLIPSDDLPEQVMDVLVVKAEDNPDKFQKEIIVRTSLELEKKGYSVLTEAELREKMGKSSSDELTVTEGSRKARELGIDAIFVFVFDGSKKVSLDVLNSQGVHCFTVKQFCGGNSPQEVARKLVKRLEFSLLRYNKRSG